MNIFLDTPCPDKRYSYPIGLSDKAHCTLVSRGLVRRIASGTYNRMSTHVHVYTYTHSHTHKL